MPKISWKTRVKGYSFFLRRKEIGYEGKKKPRTTARGQIYPDSHREAVRGSNYKGVSLFYLL